MNFNEKVLYVRALLGLTQSELAKELNVSFATINRWENDKVKPSKKMEYIFKIFCKNKNVKF